MPIPISCACGKNLRVKDEFAGKKLRCPGCQKLLVAAPPPLEEDDTPAPPKPKFDDDDDEATAVTEKPARRGPAQARDNVSDDEHDDRPRKRRRRDDEDDDGDDRPRKRRRRADDEDDDPPVRSIKERANPTAPPTSSGIPASVGAGIAMMVIAVIWFVGGLAAGILFWYPPILFIIGTCALVKGALRQ